MIQGKNIYLRAVEPEDADHLYKLENDMAVWKVSQTLKPFSKELIKEYTNNAASDIYTAKQLRLMIVLYENKKAIGTIDLFDFDPKNKRAGIGIILEEGYRDKGLAKEALILLIQYSFEILDLHQLYCNILEDNSKSIGLFKSCGFTPIGLKRDWIIWKNEWHNEYFMQLINKG